MEKEMENMLCELLGELEFDYEHEFDWIEKSKIANKINACNLLLGFDKTKEDYLSNLIKKVTN